jgi:predicted P-loop ATPase
MSSEVREHHISSGSLDSSGLQAQERCLMTAAEAARLYQKEGFSISPAMKHSKKPATEHGFKDASTDEKQVVAWWSGNAENNIMLPTGKPNKLVVIDIDCSNGKPGYEALEKWEDENGRLPPTITVTTPSGGRHYYYAVEDCKYKCTEGLLPGVDTRANGGYVIVPPSVHPGGGTYEFDGASLFEQKPAPLSGSALLLMEYSLKRETPSKQSGGGAIVPLAIEEGKRNSTLFKLARSLRHRGLSDSTIAAAVRSENKAKCKPLLSDDEVDRLIESALTYPKGGSFVSPAGIVLPFELDRYGKVKNTIDNVLVALAQDLRLAGHIWFNSLAYALTVTEQMPWDAGGACCPHEWRDSDDSGLRWYLEKEYGLTRHDVISDALRIMGERNQSNPVRDLLDTLAWDGEGRIYGMLPALLGVRHQDMELAAEAMALFMRGAVARAYHPGCKFDYMPVLVGKQGCGKSTLVRKLAINPQWHRDSFPSFEGKDAYDNLRGKWIIEVSELSALNKARDAEVVKSFLTSSVDEYREAYARRTTCRPRVCLFIGTTNKHNFLADPTGNRRFIPIEVGTAAPTLSVHSTEAEEFILQCWAEAAHKYKAGEHSLVMSPTLEARLNIYQESFEVDDGRVGVIQEYLDGKPSDSAVCVYEICEQALGLDGAKYKGNRALSIEICSILDHKVSGWTRADKKRRLPNYGVQWYWVHE